MFCFSVFLEGSRNFLALISATYLQSKVCQEEYSLARAIAEDKTTNYNLKIFSARLEKIPRGGCPHWCTYSGNMFDLENDNSEQQLALMNRLIQKMDHDRRFCKYYSSIFVTLQGKPMTQVLTLYNDFIIASYSETTF